MDISEISTMCKVVLCACKCMGVCMGAKSKITNYHNKTQKQVPGRESRDGVNGHSCSLSKFRTPGPGAQNHRN